MRAIAKFWVPALFLALAGTFGSTTSAQAQGFPVQVGQVITCNFNGPIVIRQGGQDFAGTVTGSGSFRVVSTTAYDPRVSGSVNDVTYIPVGIQATSTFPQLGVFTTSLDLNAPVPQSSTTSLESAAALFPASSAMKYPARVVGPNGGVYTSAGIVNFRSASVNTFLPFVNEPFSLEAPVVFIRNGQAAFTLVLLNATFTN